MTEQPDDPHRSDEPERPDVEASQAGRSGRGKGRWLLAGLIAVLLAAGLGVTGWFGWQVLQDLQRDPSRAEVGDCLAGSDQAGDMERVGCDAPEASWRVAGSQPGLSWAEFNAIPEDELCAEHPRSELAVWFGDDRDGGSGDLLCLEPLG